MSNNGPVKIQVDSDLVNAAPASNVAIKQAEDAAARANKPSIDGQSVYPEWVTTRGISLAESLTVGGGVSIADGSITSDMIGADQITATHINATGLTASDISFTGGSLSEFGVSTLGSITGGSLSIGSGGVTIGSSGSYLYIGGNKLIAYDTGNNPTVTIDGTTGIITCSKFALTADGTSSVNLSTGSHIFAESITVGAGTTLGGMISDTEGAQADATQALADAAAADANADTRISATQNYIGFTAGHITTITTSGITIRTSDSTARTYMDSNGFASVNSGATTIFQADHTNGVIVRNSSTTPALTERLSLYYDAIECGYLYGAQSTSKLHMYGSTGVVVGSNTSVLLQYQDAYTLTVGGTGIVLNGNLTMGSTDKVVFEAGAQDPSISAGAIGSISEGSSATGYAFGSIYMSSGGSLWTVYSDGGTPKWTEIHTGHND